MTIHPRREWPAESDAVAGDVTIQNRSQFNDAPYRRGFDDAREERGFIDLRNVLRVLNRRKWLIAAVAGAFGALGFARTLLQEPMYAATVRLQINRSLPSFGKSAAIPLIEFDDSWFDTEVELLNSRDLAERVASSVAIQPSSGRAADREATIDRVLAGVSIKAVKSTHLVDITYSDREPARAQRIARAYGEAYLAANRDKRLQTNADAKSLLEDQITQLKARLENADQAVLAFAKRERIIATTDKASITETSLAAAGSALSNLVAERIRNEQLWRQVEDQSAELPQILTNRAIEELRGQRRQLLSEYQEKSETFRADYPAMAQLRSKIRETDRQLDAEIKTVRSSLKAAFEASLNQENEMKRRVEKLREDMLELQRRSIQYNILKHDAEVTRSLYDSLLERYKEVDISGSGANRIVYIVDKARLPRAPIKPDRLKWFLASLVLGLVVGAVIVWAIEDLDDLVHAPSDAEQASGLPLLGVIPKPRRRQSFEAATEDAVSAISDAFRSACLLLQFSTEYGVPKTLMVTSANPAEGKSSTALGIAREFATMGLKVLVIDADLRKPSLHMKAGLDNSVGLTTYLTRNCEANEAIQHFARYNLFVMTSGPTPPNPVELLNGPRFASLLSGSSDVFDLVVIDGPPVMGPAETLLLSNAVTATVLIVAAGETRSSHVHAAVKLLQQARGATIGAILTKFADNLDYRYGYGYSYRYSSENGVGERRESDSGDRASVTQPSGSSRSLVDRA